MGRRNGHLLNPHRWELKKTWYQQVKDLIAELDDINEQTVLDENDQRRLNIHLSFFSAQTDAPSDFEPQFFTPMQRENLVVSPCAPDLGDHSSIWPRKNEGIEDPLLGEHRDYIDGRGFAEDIVSHLQVVNRKMPSKWMVPGLHEPLRRTARYFGFKCEFVVQHVFDMYSSRRPHQILLMTSDHRADEGSLLRNEALAIVSFMRWKMNSFFRYHTLVYPVMVLSIHSLFKVRILQGHFDGHLHIRCSEFYDFAVPDHEEAMKVIICWLKSTAHGDTTLSTILPIRSHFSPEEHDDGSDGTAEPAVAASNVSNADA